MSTPIREPVPAPVTPSALDSLADDRRQRLVHADVRGASWKVTKSIGTWGGSRAGGWKTTCRLTVSFAPDNPNLLIGTASVRAIGSILRRLVWGMLPVLLLGLLIGFVSDSYVALVGIPTVGLLLVGWLAVRTGYRRSAEMEDRLGRKAIAELVAACAAVAQ